MLEASLKSTAPSVEVKRKFFPVPEILASVNADPEIIRQNVKENITKGFPQVEPYETQWEKVIALVLGGASLKDNFNDLLEKRKNGMPVVAVNGTYKY